MNQAAKTYMMQFGASMALYAVIVFISAWLLNNVAVAAWRVPVALLPVIPMIMGLVAFVRFFRTMDELQKRIQLDALAFAFIASGLLTFTYGLLQNAGLPQVSFIAVFPLMIALWGVGSVFASRRYQ